MRLTLVVLILCKETADNVAHAARNVHKWAFLTEGQTGADAHREPYGLSKKRPAAEVSVNDETREDRLDLRNATACCLTTAGIQNDNKL